MINNLLRSTAWLLSASFGLSACAAFNDGQTKTLPVSEIYSSTHCNISEEGITAIKDKKHLQKVLKKANSHRLEPQAVELSSIDFASSQIFLIAIGNKPNTGYTLSKTGNEARLINGTLHLPVQTKLPSKDGMYGQMMTSPCLLLAVPAGKYESIIVDGMDTL